MDNIDELLNIIKKQQEKIDKLENIYENIDTFIKEEVAKATFHQSKSVQHRIDQFLFDAKVALKNNDSDFFNSLESLTKRHFGES